jgi:23S rRNA (uracil1939-C5)-methyltransferase
MCIVQIKKLVNTGYGLGYRYSSPHDKEDIADTSESDAVYFVQNGLPDDVLKVDKIYKKKNAFFCTISKIVKRSHFRQSQRCAVSGSCGACDWVDVDYVHQLLFKKQILSDIFGDMSSVIDIKASPHIDFYRNKSIYPVMYSDGNLLVGMFARQTHTIIEHAQCFLNPPIFVGILQAIRQWIAEANISVYDEIKHTGDLRHICIRCTHDLSSILVILVTRRSKLGFTNLLSKKLTDAYPEIKGIVQNIQSEKNNVILGDKEKVLHGDRYITDKLLDKSFYIDYSAFFQINTAQAQHIYKDIASLLHPDDIVIDAYSGIGSIGITISDKVKKVICIESDVQSHLSAEKNAEINHIKNISFICAEVENAIEKILDGDISAIVFDPPRKGLEKSIIEKVAEKKIKKIIYLSCNPMTQKRDIELFIYKGYQVVSLQGYDMFPHTWHIESLVVLERG